MPIISPSLISNSHFEKTETTTVGNPKHSQISRISHPWLTIFFFAVIRAMKGASHLRTISGVERTTNVKGLSVWSMKGHTFGMVNWLRCWWWCWWWWRWCEMMVIDRIHTFGMVNTMDLRIFWLGMIEQHTWLEGLGITSWYFRFCKEISDFK